MFHTLCRLALFFGDLHLQDLLLLSLQERRHGVKVFFGRLEGRVRERLKNDEDSIDGRLDSETTGT